MYVTIEEYRTYANGILDDLTDDQCNSQLLAASIFIDSNEQFLKGQRATRDQLYSYPRKNLVINGYDYTVTEIPNIVKTCQMALALEINAGIDLYSNTSGTLPVVRERIEGAVDVEYARPASVSVKPRNSVAMSLLNQLMKPVSFSIPLVRA